MKPTIVVRSNYGRVVHCHVCKSDQTVGYVVHCPPFADAIDSVYYAFCNDHEAEVRADVRKAEQAKDRINMAGSGS